MQRELTSIPPLTFVSNGENLVDYRIDGASGGVGDLVTDENDANFGKYAIPVTTSGKNLFNGYLEMGSFTATDGVDFNTTSSCRTNYIDVAENTAYSVSISEAIIQYIGYYGNDYWSYADVRTANAYNFTTPPRTQRIRIIFKNITGENIDLRVFPTDTIQLEKNSAVTDYEPYHSPVTTNIHLDEPLEENESISMSDTGLLIPTINGSNTLSIDTTIQPSSVYVKYAANEKSVPARTYLQGVEEMDNWAIYNYINREGSGALKNESTVTPTTVEMGNTIQFNGAASGGTAPYKYWFQYKKSTSSTWTTLGTEYGTAATATLRPGTAVGYNAKITVKDGKGTIKSKIFNVDVTAASTTNNTLTLDKLSFGSADEFTVDNDRAGLTVEDNTLEEV